MTFPKARLVVSACLFLGWIGFLLYLVIDSPTVIVSKPQFLVASLYVTAELGAERKHADPHVTIDEVLWSADPADRKLAKQAITVANLLACGKSEGFQAPGKYVLPLMKHSTGEMSVFQIAPLPNLNLRIYPLTSQTRAQVDTIVGLRN